MVYDVIIIGAGPAGSVTGYHLASAGFHVLMLEKETLPRYKPCAGAVAARTLDILDFDVSPALERSIHSVYFTHKFGKGYLFTADLPLAYMVMRDKFDHLLTRKAVQAGTEVIQEAKATEVRIQEDGAVVTAGGRQFRGRIVVGADGSKSTVAKVLGLSTPRRLVITVQSEVFVEPSTLAEHRSRMWMDIGAVPLGYAWLFPKTDHLSMGIGALQKKARGLKELFWRCLKYMVPDYVSIRVYVHPLTIWGRKHKLAANRVVLVGDAAGVTDPLTGEGIYYAIRSGIIAARAIERCLSQNRYDMGEYERSMKSELGRSLQMAVNLSALFYALPRLTHRLTLCNHRFTAYFGQMMQRNEGRSYIDFCRSIGNLTFG